MSNVTDGQGCRVKCWSVAGGIGVLTAIFLAAAGKGVMAGLILGVLVAVLLGLLFTWLTCSPVPAIGASKSGTGVDDAVAPAQPAATAPIVAKPAPEQPAAVEPEAGDQVADDVVESAEPVVKPSTALAGQTELSEKKGDWRYQGGDAPKGATVPEPLLKPSKALAGQSELADRKGSWRYEGGDKPASGAAPAEPADLDEDYDQDGILEGTDEGTRPDLLEVPREGGPDNLKEIKGIGPKLEKVCHSLGVYHFSQIAAWSEDEVAWANANLVGFKGRVTRDNWVEQAKILEAGGETEFSARVDKGGVY